MQGAGKTHPAGLAGSMGPCVNLLWGQWADSGHKEQPGKDPNSAST